MGAQVASGQAGIDAGHRRDPTGRLLRPGALGLLASLALLLIYLGTIALVQDWGYAVYQLGEDLPFVVALMAGFGLQVGLFAYLRSLAARTRKAGVAASAGASGVAMLACCAHHLTDVLPIVGLSAVAAFVGAYKAPLLWLSVASNIGGVAYLAWQLRKVMRTPGAPTEQPVVCHTSHPPATG